MKVLVSDKLSPAAIDIFREKKIDADMRPGLSKEALHAIIGGYEGLAVRSATRVDEALLAKAGRLKVVGRAGVGVDNIDIPAASRKGVIVMNAPLGNAITTAEHALAMMMALARNIPEADHSTRAGKWEKNRFTGVELAGKLLGVIGCGNIGAIVARRALGLDMQVIVHDPFLSSERAKNLGVEKVDLETLFARADIITLHTPQTEKTKNLINANNIAAMKKGVRLVNCARGGLVVEKDLREALVSGHVAGAALDVFSVEPAKENILFDAPNIICTPHLGASTSEAQEKVAVQIARQMGDYLSTGAISYAINMPSISAEEAPVLQPFIRLAEQLGLFLGQLLRTGILEINIEFEGEVADMNTAALTSAALAGVMKPSMSDVNMISAPAMLRQRGVKISETRRAQSGAYETYIRLTVRTEKSTCAVAGTIFSDGRPRIIQANKIDVEAELGGHMLYVANHDRPGFIGALGKLLSDAGVNIASFHLGRRAAGGEAMALVALDASLPEELLQKVQALDHVVEAALLHF